MDQTTNLSLPFIMPSQAQKQVSHNEALRILDALVQLAVLTRSLSDPPASPVEGARYIVAAGGSGAWSGKDAAIAAWQDGAWRCFAPLPGWQAWVSDESRLLVWDGTGWIAASSTMRQLQNLSLLGVGTTADAANPFAAKLDTALWSAKYTGEGGTGDLRYTMNKQASGNTVSLLLQNNWSGRAEIGLTGDDNLHFKVSPDGSNWNDALVVTAASGRVSFPQGATGLREQLTADRTYYVRPDGDDANDGLSDSASGAFRTIQQAIDAAVALDLSIYAVTINVAKGTYAENVTLKSYLGVGPITLVGDTTTPTNVDIAPASGTAVAAPQVTGVWALDGFELSSDVTCLDVSNYSVVNIDNIAFNGTGTHIYSHVGAYINGAGGSFAILQATCARHVFVHLAGAQAALNSATCTLPTDGLDSSTAFADVSALSFATFVSATFINGAAATGLRYVVDSNAVINGGGNANLLPGDTAGTTATGGQYT
jgi:hypothetical protein